MSNNNNDVLKRGAQNGLDSMKMEIASELGLDNYDSMDKGNLTSRQNGSVGGNMVKRLVASAEEQLAGK